jgi:hypothetical protein
MYEIFIEKNKGEVGQVNNGDDLSQNLSRDIVTFFIECGGLS